MAVETKTGESNEREHSKGGGETEISSNDERNSSSSGTTRRRRSSESSNVLESASSSTSRRRNDENPEPWVRLDYSPPNYLDRKSEATTDAETPVGATEHDVAVTGWNNSDVPAAKRQYWKHLQNLNDGVGDSDRKRAKRQSDIERTLDVVAGQLDIGNHAHERALWLLERIDIHDDIDRSTSIEAVVLGVATLVVDKERSRYDTLQSDAAYDHVTQSVLRDEAFKQLRSDFCLEPNEVRKVRRAVRETDLWRN